MLISTPNSLDAQSSHAFKHRILLQWLFTLGMWCVICVYKWRLITGEPLKKFVSNRMLDSGELGNGTVQHKELHKKVRKVDIGYWHVYIFGL